MQLAASASAYELPIRRRTRLAIDAHSEGEKGDGTSKKGVMRMWVAPHGNATPPATQGYELR
jgi:hypothetical protein